MLVNFKRAYFGPNSVLYSPENNPNEVPHTWEDTLPPDAEIVMEEPKAKPAAKSAKADD